MGKFDGVLLASDFDNTILSLKDPETRISPYEIRASGPLFIFCFFAVD